MTELPPRPCSSRIVYHLPYYTSLLPHSSIHPSARPSRSTPLVSLSLQTSLRGLATVKIDLSIKRSKFSPASQWFSDRSLVPEFAAEISFSNHCSVEVASFPPADFDKVGAQWISKNASQWALTLSESYLKLNTWYIRRFPRPRWVPGVCLKRIHEISLESLLGLYICICRFWRARSADDVKSEA